MAAAVSCGEQSRNHGTGSLLIARIQFVQTLPLFTAYDVLDLPMYKTHAEHATNHALLVAELSLPACTCANRATSLTAVNVAWARIATPALKIAYDNTIDAVPPLVTPYVFQVGAFPSTNGEWERRYPDHMGYPGRTPNPGFPMNHPLCPFFKGVHFSPGTSFIKQPRSRTLLFRRIESSFWFALSMSMYPSEAVWPELKYRVGVYLNSVIASPAEPRFEYYWSLLNFAFNTRFPYGNLLQQVISDLQGPYEVEPVTPELWQIVADAFQIELMVIIAHVPRGRRPAHKTIVPRGSPKHRQVYLYLEEDGEYRSVVPFVDNPAEYRFTGHLPPSYTNSPRDGDVINTRDAAQEASDLRRCPLLVTNEWGLPVHLDPPRGHPAVPLRGIEISSPQLPYPPLFVYDVPFEALPAISHDANPRDRGQQTPQDVFEMLNPPSGRWV
ncbi:hypothetical protein ONS96_010447 [Cadophora gregata f. sp. sojae]|nr:hypothetical protein ONS96_010447 [Cadophora gregata f. sp. sojae]